MNTVSSHAEPTPFKSSWEANYITPDHPVIAAANWIVDGELGQNDHEPTIVYFTEVTLRDGQQQQTDAVTTEERLAVFDSIVKTGVDIIEIGHLGNGNGDQQLAREIVKQVAEREDRDERYARIRLQVLFGSQGHLIREGIGVLEAAFQEHYGTDGWRRAMSDMVVVHVYDRLDENLRDTSSTPYTAEESAARICSAAQHALDAGFRQFSISGEGATAARPETAIQFYRTINQYLVEREASIVNVNLANTYGYSPHGDWNAATLAIFNAAVKHGFDNRITTSIHMHNDVNNALDFSMAALVAGFNRVEGTHIGMGERAGNVANVDVMARILEQAKHAVDTEERVATEQSRIAQGTGKLVLRRNIQLPVDVVPYLEHWYATGEYMSEVFGEHAAYRWKRTTLGNPYQNHNGSGPHDHAMAAAIMNPVKYPPYRHYQWFLAVADILGKPDAKDLAVGEPTAVDRVTVGNYAGGGKTQKIKRGLIPRAEPETVAQAQDIFAKYTERIVRRAVEGVNIVAL